MIPAGRNGPAVTININGPVYGMDDFRRKVADAIKQTKAIGGLDYLTA